MARNSEIFRSLGISDARRSPSLFVPSCHCNPTLSAHAQNASFNVSLNLCSEMQEHGGNARIRKRPATSVPRDDVENSDRVLRSKVDSQKAIDPPAAAPAVLYAGMRVPVCSCVSRPSLSHLKMCSRRSSQRRPRVARPPRQRGSQRQHRPNHLPLRFPVQGHIHNPLERLVQARRRLCRIQEPALYRPRRAPHHINRLRNRQSEQHV